MGEHHAFVDDLLRLRCMKGIDDSMVRSSLIAVMGICDRLDRKRAWLALCWMVAFLSLVVGISATAFTALVVGAPPVSGGVPWIVFAASVFEVLFYFLLTIFLVGPLSMLSAESRRAILSGDLPPLVDGIPVPREDLPGDIAESMVTESKIHAMFGRVSIFLLSLVMFGVSVWAIVQLVVDSGWPYVLTRVTTIVLAFILVSSVTTAIARPIDRRLGDPVSELLRDLAICLARASDLTEDIWSYRSVDAANAEFRTLSWKVDRKARRNLARRLFVTARHTEARFPYHAPRDCRHLRREYHVQASRIAAGFDQHAKAILLGGISSDERLDRSLAHGLAAALYGEWDELCRQDPSPPIETFIEKWGRPILVGVVLVVAAFVVPLAFELDPATTTPLRALLLSAALVSLVQAPREAILKVGEGIASLGKDS